MRRLNNYLAGAAASVGIVAAGAGLYHEYQLLTGETPSQQHAAQQAGRLSVGDQVVHPKSHYQTPEEAITIITEEVGTAAILVTAGGLYAADARRRRAEEAAAQEAWPAIRESIRRVAEPL